METGKGKTMSKQSEDVVYIESGKRWAKIPAPSPTVEHRIAAILIGLRRGDTSLPELIKELEELVV